MQALLTKEHKVALRSDIRERLTQAPFSSALLFQEFAARNETYKDVSEPGTPAEDQG